MRAPATCKLGTRLPQAGQSVQWRGCTASGLPQIRLAAGQASAGAEKRLRTRLLSERCDDFTLNQPRRLQGCSARVEKVSSTLLWLNRSSAGEPPGQRYTGSCYHFSHVDNTDFYPPK